MTSAMPVNYELFNWVQPTSIRSNPPPISRPGIAEIKPHTASGIAAGERQLRRRKVPPDRQLWLLTYLLVSQPSSGKEGRARVLAYHVTQTGKDGPWDLGDVVIPEKIPFPHPRHPAFFGMAIEPIVRTRFKNWVPSGSTVRRGTGGARRGADVKWNELAYFYNELGSETGDPFFRELASELMEMVA